MFHVKLSRLEINGVRNLSSVALDELARVNVFYGSNGAGKTSVLEAINILGLARSFRGTQLQPVIQYKSPACTVFGQLIPVSGQAAVALGVKRSRRGGHKIRIAGNDEKSLVRLAEMLPIQLINATAYSLLEGGPKQRRQFLDWGVFHVEHGFYDAWRRMQRGLKQRNAVLRSGSANQQALAAWNQELSDVSTLIDEARQQYFESFVPVFRRFLGQLIDLPDLEMSYLRGWDSAQSLQQVFDSSFDRDLRRGFTHFGPHRADLRLTIHGLEAGQVLSRGQQKLVVCALRLAQTDLMVKTTGKKCILLVDDMPAEIDAFHQGNLCELLNSLDVQLFLTCVEANDLVHHGWNQPDVLKVFHVEQGAVEPVEDLSQFRLAAAE